MDLGRALQNFRLREFNCNVRLFYLYGILINAGMALFFLLFNLYLLRLSYQEDFIGQVAGMAPLATGLLALPVGVLSDRWGRRPFLVASGLLLALSQLGLCLSTAPAPLLAFSFLGGAATACIWVNHVPFLSDNARPARRAEALVLWSALQVVVRMVLSLGGGFMPGFIGAWLDLSTQAPAPFRYALLLGVACSLASVLPLLRVSGPTGRPAQAARPDPSPEDDRPAVPVARAYTAITLLNGMRGFSTGLTFPFFNVFFEEELHLGAAAIGAVFFLSQFTGLPATFAAPALGRRWGLGLTILGARLVNGGAFGLMGALVSLPVALPMFLLGRAAEVVDNPSDQHLSTQILPRRHLARIQGFRVCGFQILNFAGSVLGGALILEYGYLAAFGLAGAARAASGLVSTAAFGLRRPVDGS